MTRATLTSTCAAALMALTVTAGAQTAPQTQVPDQPQAIVAPESAPAVAPVAQTPGSATAPVADDAPLAPVAAEEAPAPLVSAAPAAAPVDAAPAAEAAPVAPAPAPSEGVPAQSVDAVSQAVSEAAPAVVAAPPEVSGGPALPKAHDMSPMGMYHQADWVVKSVMIILALACFATWTIWLFKLVETFVARRRARGAARVLSTAQSLDAATRSLTGRRDPAAFMAHAIHEEFKRSYAAIDEAGPDGVKERAVSLIGRVEAQAAARLRRGMGMLATVGSVAPFVGLFGTVWGIMNSFIGIAESQTTNLAVVAPGIAEALFATAIGLVAAIPAVVIYNSFTRTLAAYKQSLSDASAAALRLLSRDIDFRHVKGL